MYVFFDLPAPFGVPPGRVGNSPAHRWGLVAASLPALGGLLSAFAAAGDPSPPLFFYGRSGGSWSVVALALLPSTCARVYFSVVGALSPFSWLF